MSTTPRELPELSPCIWCANPDGPPESQREVIVGDPDVVVEGEDRVRPDEVQGKKAVLEAVRLGPHDEELILGKHFGEVFWYTSIDIVPYDNHLKLKLYSRYLIL